MPKLDQIDALRGIAILLVFLHHSTAEYFPQIVPVWNHQWATYDVANLPWLAIASVWGFVGVPLFFAISGYCIALSWLRSKSGWTGFAIRRFFRIYPPYLFWLSIFLTWFPYSGRPISVAAHLLLMHNFVPGGVIGDINPSYWSVAVEAQYYALFPLVLAAVGRIGWLGCCCCSGLVALIIPVVCLVQGWSMEKIPVLFHFPTNTWITWIAGGMVGYQVAPFAGLGVSGRWSFLAIMVGFFVFAQFWWPLHLFAQLLFGVLAVWAVKAASAGKLVVFAGRPLVAVGTCSYSLYLLHQPLLPLVKNGISGLIGGPVGYYAFVVVSLAVCLSLSYLSYLLIELPAVALGRRMESRLVGNRALRLSASGN